MSRATIDSVISTLRPVPLKGKGFVFDYVTPHEGIRQATVAGSYSMTLDLADAIHRQVYMGCFGNAMTRWAKALLGAGGTFLDVGAHVGYFSLIAADRAGRVIAVEPIDVEGAEPPVFAGGIVHLTRGTVRHAMIEINGPRLAEGGSSPGALIDQLGALGFEPARVSHGRAMRVAPTDIDLDPAHEWDRLFVHTTTLEIGS